ncbi:MAG: hypothetical protein IJZ48_06475 [Oscillospiraceae bacterium]|nr:hypothetical protein [Oscillospiraceae bacterium]
MKKRVLAMLVAAILLMGAFAVNVSAEATTAIEEWNIVLGDQIGANFYVNVPENTADAAVKVTVADRTETHALTAPNSKGLYKVSVNVAAAQMTEEITLQLVADGTEYAPVSYSIREYAEHILKGNYSDDVKTVVKHMLDYGAAAQTYFGVQTENLANAGYKMDYTAQYPAKYPELAVEGQLAGVRLYGASLVMDSKVAMHYYFAADSVEDVTFSVNGVNYPAAKKNGLFYVEVPGILPQQYGNSIVLCAQKGDEKLDVAYSPLTYMVRMSQKGSEEMKALVNAMYGYYEAAVAYTDSAVFSAVSGSWDLSNQYNGSLTILNQKDGTTVKTNANNYKEVSVKVKDFFPKYDDAGKIAPNGFAMQICFIFDNGKQYQVRLHNTDTDQPNYKLQNMGGDNSITGWKWQADLTTAQKEKLINGDGVEFTVKLVGPNAELWLDGTRMKVVQLGAEYEGQTARVSLCMNGNKGVQNLEIPFALKAATNAPVVQFNIAELTNGTVTTEYDKYQVGDTVFLTVQPDAGYSQKLYINGKPLLLGGNTNSYSFVATEEVYNITGSFEPDVFSTVKGNWSLNDQQHGDLIITSQKDGTTVQTNASGYKEVSVTVKDHTPSKNEDGTLKKGNFSMQVAMIFDDGKEYQVRLHNTDDNMPNYKLQTVGGENSITGTGWPWLADLTTAQKAKLLDGDGVEFAVRLVDSKAELWVDGTRMKVIELGEAYEGKLAKVKLCMNGNTGVQNLHIPYELKTAAAAVELNIAELTNGTVVPENDKYQVGDTVFMTVNADAGYSQKLYINGQPMLLDAGSNVYSFVATEEVYNITGSFESDLFRATSGNWDLGNQNQGVITIVNKTKDGSTVITNANNYKEVAVTVKDYTPSRNEDGSLKKGDFSMQVAMIFDDGKYYEVRIHNTDKDGNYKLQNVGNSNNLGGSGWTWLADLTAAQKAKLLDGDGVEFAVKLVGPNVELWVDGSIMKVIELGAQYDGKLAQVKLCMNGNKNGQNTVIPFELKVPEEAPTVKFNIPELANGTVTPGYDAYKVGETVTLAVSANAGYSQKLYINGEPLMLDWQSNTCSFVATEAVYNITGSFEPSITFTSTSKWNIGNQAHGVLDTYYASGDSGWLGIEGGYDSITVTAKNNLPGDDGTGANGFAVLLGFKMSNGKTYTFRLIKENGVYYCQRAGFAKPEGGNDWTKKKLDDAAIAAVNGAGAEFKVERTAANVLTISVNGTVYDTYTMADTTEEVTVTRGYIGHYGNVGQNITIPFTLAKTK